jgi:hypothetical protein
VAAICFAALTLILSVTPARAQPAAPRDNPILIRMDSGVQEIAGRPAFDYDAYLVAADSNRVILQQLLAEDQVRTPGDFFHASSAVSDLGGYYENRRIEHEMALMALILGHPDAAKRFALTWDALHFSLGRGQRLGRYTRDGVPYKMALNPAPSLVREWFADTMAVHPTARGPANAELERIRAADQADRVEPIDATKVQSMRRNDPLRLARVKELLDQGVPSTGRDFHNAAVVLQHADEADDYALAHELAVVAVALGDTSAVWLISRTYDRMLLKLGHRQRFGTQYLGSRLQPMDTTAVNDRIRVTLGSRRLAEIVR